MTTNIVEARFGAHSSVRTRPLYQWDYGQVLQLAGPALPAAYEVHYSNDSVGGASVTQIGDEDGASIPDALLTTGKPVFAWVYLHTGEDDGETMYAVTIPVLRRPQPTNGTPPPVQQDAITEAIAALNTAVAQTGQDVVRADAAKAAAEAARGLAETARAAAETAQGAAEGALAGATAAASAAAGSANAADEARSLAETARDAARGYAGDAAESAEQAEQAATTAGYMWFEINERGHLIYTRVGYHDTMFSLRDGHLILGVS